MLEGFPDNSNKYETIFEKKLHSNLQIYLLDRNMRNICSALILMSETQAILGGLSQNMIEVEGSVNCLTSCFPAWAPPPCGRTPPWPTPWPP